MGPWTGTVLYTKKGVVASVTEDKCVKTREIILDPGALLGADKLPHKSL